MTKSTNVRVVASDEFAAAQYHMNLAAEHSKLANEHLERYHRSLPGGGVTAGDLRRGTRKGPRCVKVWTEWLDANGPDYRQVVTDGTGMKFTERGTPYTVEWEDGMETFPDEQFADDTIFRIRGIREDGGRGGAPVLFFLWRHRWDIHGTFGVGPAYRPPSTVTDRPEPESIQGVIRPPDDPGIMEWGTVTDVTPEKSEPTEEPDTVSVSFDSMGDWHARWDPFLEQLAPHDAKPSEEEFDEMVNTLPSDITDDPKAIVAKAYSDARRRAQSNN